jgi:hypothetical protein
LSPALTAAAQSLLPWWAYHQYPLFTVLYTALMGIVLLRLSEMSSLLSGPLGFFDSCIIKLGIITQFHMQLYSKPNVSENALECASFIGESASYAIGYVEKCIVGLVVGLGILSIITVVSVIGLGVFAFVLMVVFKCTLPRVFSWVTTDQRPRARN